MRQHWVGRVNTLGVELLLASEAFSSRGQQRLNKVISSCVVGKAQTVINFDRLDAFHEANKTSVFLRTMQGKENTNNSSHLLSTEPNLHWG